MSTSFDNEDEDDFPALPPTIPTRFSFGDANARASSSRLPERGSSIASESRSFLSRLEASVSPNGKSERRSILEEESKLGDEDGVLGLEEEGDEGELDEVRRMGRVWVRERGTVEVMRWEGDLVDSLMDKLEQQQKMLQTLRSDPQTSEEEHFKLVLVQTEMERVKFLIRSYVRTRLVKVERYSYWMTSTPSVHPLLSGAELSHARRYTELLHTHFHHSALDSLPEWLRKTDDTYGDGLSMVTKPNRNVPVLIYCRKDCGEITLEGGERAALAKGTTHLVKYRLVDRWIKLGWAEVL